MTAGDEVPVETREGRVVDLEDHRDGRLVDRDRGQRVGLIDRAQGVPDPDLLDPRDHGHVASHDLLDGGALQSLVAEEVLHRHRHRLGPIGVGDPDAGAGSEDPAVHAPDRDAAQVVVVIERGGLELEAGRGVGPREGDVLEEPLREGAEVALGRGGLGRGPAVTTGAVDHREVELVVGRAQVHEEVEDLVQHLVGAGVRAVDLVDHHQRLEAVLEGLLEDEARLRHRALEGVDQQQDGVRHRQGSLHLTTEVGVSGRVDDVDPVPLQRDGRVLGEDRDPALALLRVRVHHPLGDLLALPEGARVAEQGVDEGGLPVVDVGHDGHVADAALGHGGDWVRSVEPHILLRAPRPASAPSQDPVSGLSAGRGPAGRAPAGRSSGGPSCGTRPRGSPCPCGRTGTGA